MKNHKLCRRKTCTINSQSKKILWVMIILTGFLFLLCANSVSAFQFDNIKRDLILDKDTSEYGKIEIRNSVFGWEWFQLDKIMSLELKENTEQCPSTGCSAKQEIIMYEDGKLIDDIRFIDLETGTETNIKNYDIYVNGNLYNGEEVSGYSKGVKYDVELKGNLFAFQSVDWQIKSAGTDWIDDWAVWTGSLTNGTMAYWKFDEAAGTNVKDFTGNYDLTTNTPNWVSGLLGNALNFTQSGGTDYVAYNDTFLDRNMTDFSLSLWFKLDNWYNSTRTDNPYFFGKEDSAANRFEGGFHPASGKFFLLITGEGAGIKNMYSNATHWDEERWYHFVLVWDGGSNISLYFNGEQNHTIDYTGKLNTTTLTHDFMLGASSDHAKIWNGTIDETGVWDRILTVSEISDLYNAGVGISPADLTVTLNSPADDYGTIDKNITFNCTASSPALNISNISLYHNDTGTWTLNQTNSTTRKSNSTSIFYVDFQDYGSIEWNCYACDNESTCVYGNNRTVVIEKFTVESETHNATTYETARETFLISFGIAEDLEISLIQLVYNETNHTVSDIVKTATTINASKTIDIPVNVNDFINETRDFFFRLTYAGADVQETDLYYQNVSFANLQLCNATYSTEALNFTYYDELTSAEIDAAANATSIQTTFNYWIGSGDIYKNYSYNKLTNNAASQYKFCIFPAWQTFKTNMDLDYEAEAYAPRTYYLRNATLTNQTNEISLNLLTISDSVKFFITVLEGMVPFPNAIVTISKFFTGEGIYRTIGIRETDELGDFIEYLDLDKKYQYFIVRDGTSYGTIIKQASCTEAPCEITLQLEEATVDMWQGYYDTHAVSVAYTLFYNDTNKIVTYTFNDLTGLAQYFRLLVTQMSANQTGSTICDDSLYSTSGTLTCNMTGYDGDFRATSYIHRSPGRIVDFILFVISTIKDTLGATGILISLFIIVTVALVGSWNPAVGVILVAFSVFMMKILGFVAFGYTTVILIFILAVILAVKMKT